MSDTTHFEVPKSFVYKVVGALVGIILALSANTYMTDEKVTRASLISNQQAIQKTLDGMEENEKNIAVGQERMDGHVVNPVAHIN